MLEDKPLWKQLVEQQYNRFKPRLDYMVEKYGEEFTMTEYGTVFSVEHPDWVPGISYNSTTGLFEDNYVFRLKRDELESIMMDIAEPIWGECKIYLDESPYTSLGADSTAEELLSKAKSSYMLYVVQTNFGNDEALLKTFLERILAERYQVSTIIALFAEHDVFGDIQRPVPTSNFEHDRCVYWIKASLRNGVYKLSIRR